MSTQTLEHAWQSCTSLGIKKWSKPNVRTGVWYLWLMKSAQLGKEAMNSFQWKTLCSHWQKGTPKTQCALTHPDGSQKITPCITHGCLLHLRRRRSVHGGGREGCTCSRRAWRGRRWAGRRRSSDNKPTRRRRMGSWICRASHQSRMGRWHRKLKGTNKCSLCWRNHRGRRRRGRTCRIVIIHHLSWEHPI